MFGKDLVNGKKTSKLSICIQKPKSEVVFKYVLPNVVLKTKFDKLTYPLAKKKNHPVSIVECTKLGFCMPICKVVVELHIQYLRLLKAVGT